MKNPPNSEVHTGAINTMRISASMLIRSVTDQHVGTYTADQINDIKLATSIWDQADRLEKEMKG